jgi:hypothetical protein
MNGVAPFTCWVYDSPGIASDSEAVSVTPGFRSSVEVKAVRATGID